ncbi:DUF748 domain-containing protein [Candidatus Deferrimicrobium sp.]|uniref:DUF748 domain-containing protein n=1 Tax=Candidatus Deferrimicrobium sp. TaxID=3060586 RepID=UPI002ED2C487
MSRFWKWVLGIVVFLALLIIVLSYLIPNDALRRHAERQMNRHLTDYTVRVGRAYFHPVGLSLDLDDLVLIQNGIPDPPIANIKRLHASVHWRALIKGRLVGDFLIDRPKLHLNLKNVRKEAASETTLEQKGWQDALEAVYPLKIDVFRIRNGALTYIDQGPYKPLQASEIFLHATNIRNIFSPEHVYPSPVKLEATLFEKGKLTLDGHANFLQKPRVGFKGEVDLRGVDLGYFMPIAERQNLSVRKGVFSANGNMEFGPKNTEVHMKEIEFKNLDADYDLRPETMAKEKEQVEMATTAAKEMSNAPTSKIRVDVLKITQGTLGYMNRKTDPNVRIYADHIDASFKDFSNQLAEGPSEFQMRGRFMGSGDTRVTGTFRPESKNPNLGLKIAIDNTDMKAMSGIFQAYGKFDIKKGEFSFFSEMTIRNNLVQGYVKPIFKNMEVTDMRTPEQKNLFHKLYVGVVKVVVTKLLKNRPLQQVATETDISGPLESPSTNTGQIIVNLIRNAFFKAILPGFEREVSRGQQKQK